MIFVILLFHSLIISTVLFLLLNSKSNVGLRHLFSENLIIALISTIFSYLFDESYIDNLMFSLILNSLMVPTLLGLTILIRIYRVPHRKFKARPKDIVSPADGQVIYIKRVEANMIPISIKNSVSFKLDELRNMNILKNPCWLIGIKITPFDVHRNAAPISGKILLNRYIEKSSKNDEKLKNMRNSLVIDNGEFQVGIVQIASKRVSRFVSYYKENESINRGEWFGIIKFGSQIDIIIPTHYKVEMNIKDQVYAAKTIIATPDDAS